MQKKVLGAQQYAIQKMINAVCDLHIAWHDPMSTTYAQEKPPLNKDMVLALDKLMKMSKQIFSLSITHVTLEKTHVF